MRNMLFQTICIKSRMLFNINLRAKTDLPKIRSFLDNENGRHFIFNFKVQKIIDNDNKK